MLLKVARLLVMILILPLLVFCLFESIVALDRSSDFNPLFRFLAGYLVTAAVYRLLLRERFKFLESLQHELSHALLSFPFGVYELVARREPDERGVAGHVRARRNTFVNVLAPYYLPTLAIPLVIVRLVMAPGRLWWVDPLIGATLALHHTWSAQDFVLSLRYQSKPVGEGEKAVVESDIRMMGCIFSFLFVVSVNALTLLLVWNLLLGNRQVLVQHVLNGIERALAFYRSMLARLGVL
jgi:hypothetical protein